MKIVEGDALLVTETTLERALLRLEIAEPGAAFYPHADGAAIDRRRYDDVAGSWGDAVRLDVVAE